MTHGYSKPWAAAYLHRAVQLARDEEVVPEQADRSIEAVARLFVDAIDPSAARAGAETAPTDVRTLPNGAKEWILLSATNYRNASAALNAHSPLAERRRFIEELQQVVLASSRDTGAAALVKRMSDNWRVALPSVVAQIPTAAEVAAAEEVMAEEVTTTEPMPVAPSEQYAPEPPVVASPVPPPAPPSPIDGEGLPVPDPAWFRVIASHTSAKVTAGAGNQPGTKEHLRRETWSKIAEWMQTLTSAVLGPDWFAEPHRNWQNSGYLNGYYWAKLYPRIGDYGTLFNVGVQIAHRVQWADELDDSLAAAGGGAVLALWVTTNDNAIDTLRKADPERLQRYRRIYRTEMDRAFREWPELWLEGGALVRWYRQASAKKSISRLVPALHYRAEVHAGRLDPERCTPDIWSPLLPLEEAIADPARTASFIAQYLPPFGAILQATYAEMARTDA
jgi:hypothetical protein